jgi:hypothetical protein
MEAHPNLTPFQVKTILFQAARHNQNGSNPGSLSNL